MSKKVIYVAGKYRDERGENLNDETMRRRMCAMGEKPSWQYLEVYDPAIKRKIKVLRKTTD